MDLRQLTYFAKVAKAKSLTHAADELNVTQPALGMQIRKLEEYLDVPLIERHSRGVRLTEAGRVLQKHAYDILERVAAAKAEVKRYSLEAIGTVRIGVNPSAGRVIVPALLQECSDEYPTINLQLTQAFGDDLAEDIQNRKLDFAITHVPIESELIESLPLYVESFLLFGVREWLDPLPDPVPLEQLVQLPMALDSRSQYLRRTIDTALEGAHQSFQDAQEILAISLRRELVAQGKRCTIGTRALFQRELEDQTLMGKRIDMDGTKITMHLNTRRVEVMTPAEGAIRQLIVRLVDDAIASNNVGWALPQNEI